MRHLLAFALALLCTAALATDKPATAPSAHATAQAAATANATANNAGGANTMQGGHLYVLPNPGAAAPLPSGMCVIGDSDSAGGLSFFKASSRTRPDMECMRMLVDLERLRLSPAPLHRPVAEILTSAPARVMPVAFQQPLCTPLAKKTKLGRGCPL